MRAEDVAEPQMFEPYRSSTCGPRESWEAARTTPLGPRFTVVRPYGQD